FLDWGHLDRAEEVLQGGLRLAQRGGDEGAQAQLFNHLGRVALARAEQEMSFGKKASARRHLTKAREFIDWSVTYNHRHARPEQGRHEEALRLLRQARAHYDETRQFIEAARTQLDIARTLADDGSPTRLVVEHLQDALHRAEACRRGDLVERIEEELRGVDEEAHWRHVFRRVRGRGAPEGTASLSSGLSEPATVLFLNLKGFVPFCQGMDPEQVMMTLNQLLADLEGVLERCAAQVTTYLGGGFMAMLREAGHAERAVGGA